MYGADGVRLPLHQTAAVASGLKMYSADGVYLPVPQEAAVADAADGAVDDAPDAEDYDYNSDSNSIIGDAESSSERSESRDPQ